MLCLLSLRRATTQTSPVACCRIYEPTLEEGEARAGEGTPETGDPLSLVPDQPEPQTGNPMKKLTKLFALLAVLALFAVACGDDDTDTTEAADDAATETTDEVVEAEPEAGDDVAEAGDDEAVDDMADDDMAEEADVFVPPARIVSINPTGTEILFAIGAGDRVVAVDSFSYYPDEAPVTDLSGWQPNLEAILAFEPDLVVMDFNGDVQAGLEAAGVTVELATAPISSRTSMARSKRSAPPPETPSRRPSWSWRCAPRSTT